MKKKNIFVSFIFAFLMCFSLSFFGSEKTAFAEDTPANITITFNPVGGVCSTQSMTIASGSSISEFPTVTRKGYQFAGWLMDSKLVSTSTIFTEDTTLYASLLSNLNHYTISKPDSFYKIVGCAGDYETTYTLSDNCDSLETAIDLISNDLCPVVESVTLVFEDITLSKDLNLSFEKLSILGTINLETYSLNYSPSVHLSTLSLKDLTLSSTGNQDMLKVLGDFSSTITSSNTTFSAVSATDNYAINLEKPIHSLIFSNNLSYSTKYLYNYDLNNRYYAQSQRKASFDETFTLTSAGTIRITIPYYVDGQTILSTFASSSTFEFFPNQANFTCSLTENSRPNTKKDLYVTTSFNFIFNSNNSTIVNEFTQTSTRFYPSQALNFPTEHNYQKEHFYLNGFLAKLTLEADTVAKHSLSSAVWYFDKTALDLFLDETKTIEDGLKLSKIPDYFYDEIPSAELTGFTYYNFTSQTDSNFLATDFMLGLNQTPEYIAIWNDIVYSISYEENGAEEISNTSETFGTSITLPDSSAISRSGYDFVGWFASLADAQEADPTKLVSYSTMPDTKPTLYAGWKIRSHTLKIYKNNSAQTIELSVDFGTPINTIADADSSTLTKTGYSFAGWFIDDAFETELDENQTMPDSDFSIFAKWTINKYYITLYLNSDDEEPFKSSERLYNIDVRDFFSESFFQTPPTPEGYIFNCWCTDKIGQFPYINPPEMMPAEDITLYASWSQLEYRLNIYHPIVNFSDYQILHFGDDLNLLAPSYSGIIFDGWFLDEDFTEQLTFSTMPSRNINVYAKFKDKSSISLSLNPQSYTTSENNGFILNSSLDDFIVEYLVNGNWTTTKPTEKGSYDVKISRLEDDLYKSFSKEIKSGLTITASNLDVGIYSLILYCIAGLELLCAIILLFIIKQRKSYLTYAVVFPFGVIPTSQFVNLIISLTLTIFGFVLITIQVVKLKKINHEIAKISIENKEYTPPDVSENKSISKKVEILLQTEGFISADDETSDEIEEDPEPDIQYDKDEFNLDNLELENDEDDDDNLTFNSKKKDLDD